MVQRFYKFGYRKWFLVTTAQVLSNYLDSLVFMVSLYKRPTAIYKKKNFCSTKVLRTVIFYHNFSMLKITHYMFLLITSYFIKLNHILTFLIKLIYLLIFLYYVQLRNLNYRSSNKKYLNYSVSSSISHFIIFDLSRWLKDLFFNYNSFLKGLNV